VNHPVDALFDADENAVVGDAAHLARDLVARLVLFGEDGPGIGLELLETEADSLALRIDLENLALQLLADLENLARVLDLLRPRHLADVHQTFDARLELDERPVVGDRLNLAAHLLARRKRLFGVAPGIFLGLLEPQRDAFGLRVVLENPYGHFVSDLEELGRMIDPAPAHVGDVEQAVDPSEIDERAVLGDVLDDAADDLALLERLKGLRLLLVALFLEENAARQNDVAPLLVELDDLELVGLPDQLIQVTDRPQVDLRPRQEGLHAAANRDRKATFDSLADGALDELVAFARGGDLIPHLHLVGFLLRKRDQAVVVLTALDVDVDLVAGLDRRLPLRVGKLVQGDDALALAADVDDDVVTLNGDDRAFDDLALFAEIASADAGFKKTRETIGVACGLLRVLACGAQGCGGLVGHG